MAKTKGLWVIKFIDYEPAVYFIGMNQYSSQLRKAKIYVWKEMAIEAAEDFLKRKWNGKPFVEGAYKIVPVELKEVE